MSAIRVLVVDDSSVARKLICAALGEHEELEVVGTAANGVLALERLRYQLPDVVLLDVEMPELDGLSTLRLIRERYPVLPVVIFSMHSERGASVVIEALTAGANDYALKPSKDGKHSIQDVVRDVLLAKLIAVTATQPASAGTPSLRARPRVNSGLMRPIGGGVTSTRPLKVLAIAASTGGPQALNEVIPLLPADLSVPVVIVQHMPPLFTRNLAERLGSRSRLRVVESQGEEILQAGTVYIAPGDYHLEVVRDLTGVRTRLSSAAPENSCRPAADVLFRSLAAAYGGQVLAVVLTGMGSDGLLGAHELVRAGARILSQSGPTCVVWGMPKAVEEAGLCDAVVPLGEMASAIMNRLSTAAATAHWGGA